MGRKRIPDTVCIIEEKKTGQLYCVEPTSQPSYFASDNYRLVGRLATMKEAAEYMHFKRLGIPCDKIAYLQIEHRVHDNPLALQSVDMERLGEMCSRAQRDTGRTCFSHCHSLEESPTCAICFSDINDTWRLCATVDIIRSALSAQSLLEEGEGEDTGAED